MDIINPAVRSAAQRKPLRPRGNPKRYAGYVLFHHGTKAC
ncbi:hypothetical protein ACPL_1099 [Actinoplanes sp. SE50/110]|nr:hypothetical protein ACPL_1099 [Actinoplanes sp. SE50/110]